MQFSTWCTREKEWRETSSAFGYTGFGYRVEPITSLIFYWPLAWGVAVLGGWDVPLGGGAAVPIQGQGLALLKQERNFMNAAVVCAELNPLCPLVCSGLIALLCLY